MGDHESTAALDGVYGKTMHQKRRFRSTDMLAFRDLQYVPFHKVLLNEINEVAQIRLRTHSTKADSYDAGWFPVNHFAVTTTSSASMVI